MRYDNPEVLRQLAAEYVLGTLRGPARLRFEALLHTHPEARAQRDFWEQRLAEFGQVLAPVAPPPALRARLLARLAPSAKVSPRRWMRRRRSLWAYAAGFASAAALLLSFQLGQRHGPAPEVSQGVAPIAAIAPVDDPQLIYTAQLRMPSSSMRWLLSITPDHQQLIVVAADDFLQIGRHRLQLWCLLPGTDPLPLGVMPNERDATRSFTLPASVRGHDQVSFAISLEPERGPQHNRPSGPVLHQAPALDAI